MNVYGYCPFTPMQSKRSYSESPVDAYQHSVTRHQVRTTAETKPGDEVKGCVRALLFEIREMGPAMFTKKCPNAGIDYERPTMSVLYFIFKTNRDSERTQVETARNTNSSLENLKFFSLDTRKS